MKLITRKIKAQSAAQDWHNQYAKDNWRWHDSKSFVTGMSKKQAYEALVALGDNPSPEDVNKVIGNTSWTDCLCNDCGKLVEEVVQLGQEPDYDSATANICFVCLYKAIELGKYE